MANQAYATSADAEAVPTLVAGDLILTPKNGQIYLPFATPLWPVNRGNKIAIQGDIQTSVFHLSGQNLRNNNPADGNYNIPITAFRGKVRITGTANFEAMRHIRFTGKYNPAEKLGLSQFPGHDAGYAFSHDKYLFEFDRMWGTSGSGWALALNNGCSNIEFEYLSFLNGWFSTIKMNDVNASLDYSGFTLHDFLIAFSHSEGLYNGSTGGDPQRKINNAQYYNFRVLGCGSEAIQIGQTYENVTVRNFVAWGGLNWRNTFQTYQDNNVQTAARAGGLTVDKGLMHGAGEKFLNFSYKPPTGGVTESLPIRFSNLMMLHNRGANEGYFGEGTTKAAPGGVTIELDTLRIGRLNYVYNQAYLPTDSRGAGQEVNVFKNVVDNAIVKLNDIKVDGTGGKTTVFKQEGAGTVVQQGPTPNQIGATVPAPKYVNFLGLPDEFDMSKIEFWAPSYFADANNAPGTRKGTLITYPVGFYLFHKSNCYYTKAEVTNVEPGAGANWQQFYDRVYWRISNGQMVYNPADLTGLSTYPPFDVRLRTDDTEYRPLGWGLTDQQGQTAPSAPTAPTGLAAVATAFDRIDLAWTDNSDNETGFQIEESQNGGVTWLALGSVGAGITAFAATGLTGTTTRSYRVRATNAGGQSAWSNVATATTPAQPPQEWCDEIIGDDIRALRRGKANYVEVATVAAATSLAVTGATFILVGADETFGDTDALYLKKGNVLRRISYVVA